MEFRSVYNQKEIVSTIIFFSIWKESKSISVIVISHNIEQFLQATSTKAQLTVHFFLSLIHIGTSKHKNLGNKLLHTQSIQIILFRSASGRIKMISAHKFMNLQSLVMRENNYDLSNHLSFHRLSLDIFVHIFVTTCKHVKSL